MSPTLQWAIGIILSVSLTICLWLLTNFLRRLEAELAEIKKAQEKHEGKDDERFEKLADRVGRFEKEFAAEVREALAKTADRADALKEWVRDRVK